MRQRVEGPTPEPENLSNGVDDAQPTSGRQALSGAAGAARSAPEGAPALPGGPEGGAAALPCLEYNNSIIAAANDLLPHLPEIVAKFDGKRVWLNLEDGTTQRFGPPTKAEIKKSFALVENLRHMGKLYGVERLGFLTLTFADNVTNFREAQRRFNSLATNILRQHFEAWVVVVEPQKRGAVHYIW